MRRLHLLISGRVQGVAFRAWTKETAFSLGITGWVRNLPDGRVEALCEGNDAAMEAMQKWCEHGPPPARVTGLETREEEYKGEFPSFIIRY